MKLLDYVPHIGKDRDGGSKLHGQKFYDWFDAWYGLDPIPETPVQEVL